MSCFSGGLPSKNLLYLSPWLSNDPVPDLHKMPQCNFSISIGQSLNYYCIKKRSCFASLLPTDIEIS